MRWAIRSIVVLVAVLVIVGGAWLYWSAAQLALEEYPVARTCALAIARYWFGLLFPFGIAMLGAGYTILEILGRPISAYSVSRWLGFCLAGICAGPLVAWFSGLAFEFARFTWLTPWPAIPILVWPRLWRHALIILATWSGVVIFGMGIDSWGPFVLAGLALTALNVYVIWQHTPVPQPLVV